MKAQLWLKRESGRPMAAPRQKRPRDAESSAAEAPGAILLSGGHAEKPRTVAAYRSGQHVDAEVR